MSGSSGGDRLAAFVVTYKRPDGLRTILNAMLAQTRKPEVILVVDNGDPRATARVLDDLALPGVEHHPMAGNVGPAGGSAHALRLLNRAGFEWILWGDDNNPPQSVDVVERLLRCVENSSLAPIAGVGAVGARFDWGIGELVRLPDDALQGEVSVDMIGGGQQLISRASVIDTVGVPNADLFFGFYEPEYCLRLRRAGYHLLVDGDVMREYRSRAGRLELNDRRSLRSGYPVDGLWQRYYRTRNYIHMMRKTFSRPDLARREAIKAAGRACLSWGRGVRYGLAFSRLQLRGVGDGYLGRLGRTVEPPSAWC